MGMFDTIVCDYPLPDVLPEFFKNPSCQPSFQTKDLDSDMSQYKLTESGELINIDGILKSYTGELEMYTGNVCASGAGVYTSEGEDAEWVSYKVTFLNGRVISIVQTAYSRKPAFPVSKFHQRLQPTPEQIAKEEALQAQYAKSRLGKELYILYGGEKVGYKVTVLVETEKEWCLKKENGELQVMWRGQLGNIIFDTEEEAQASRLERQTAWEKEQAEYDELVASRQSDQNLG